MPQERGEFEDQDVNDLTLEEFEDLDVNELIESTKGAFHDLTEVKKRWQAEGGLNRKSFFDEDD